MFGVLFYGDGATIKKLPLINILASGPHIPSLRRKSGGSRNRVNQGFTVLLDTMKITKKEKFQKRMMSTLKCGTYLRISNTVLRRTTRNMKIQVSKC
jgi:hypothetical protein